MRLTVVYAAILFHIAAALHAQQTLRVSVASDGTEADGPHAGIVRGGNTRLCIFDHDALGRLETEFLGRVEEEVGRGLAPVDGVAV